MCVSSSTEIRTEDVWRLRGLDMTRLETFTDAAFAFALSLMVISLEPPRSAAELYAAMREIPAFVASGALLMLFWWGHHTWSRRFGLDDGPTVILSCLLVFTVLVYVVPLRFLFGVLILWVGQGTGIAMGSTDLQIGGFGDLHAMFAIYGFGFMAMAGSLVLLYAHAWRRRGALELTPAECFETVSEIIVWGMLSVVGGLSGVLALVISPSAWGFPGWVYMLLPIVVPLFVVPRNRQRDRLFPPDTSTGL